MAVIRASLEELLEEGAAIGQEVQRAFGALDEEALNRQPEPGRWSIAQCLDHLRITDEGYLELGRRLADASGSKGPVPTPWTANIPGLPRLLGGLLLGSLTPEPRRRYKAPAVWAPCSSSYSVEVVPAFLERQQRVLAMIGQARHPGSERLLIPSPAAPWLCYSWADALRIVIAHQRRHLNQALVVARQSA